MTNLGRVEHWFSKFLRYFGILFPQCSLINKGQTPIYFYDDPFLMLRINWGLSPKILLYAC